MGMRTGAALRRSVLGAVAFLVAGLLASAPVQAQLLSDLLGSLTAVVRSEPHPAPPSFPSVLTQRFTQIHGGVSRPFLVLRPATKFGLGPGVLLLHYRGGNGALMADLTEAGMLARDFGVTVILPDAIGGIWQADPTAALRGDVDVGFLDALITRAIPQFGLDASRIYIGGFSQGGFMALRYACERANRLAGGFVVGAAMLNSLDQVCAPRRSVPFAFVNGTRDTRVDYDGSVGVLSAPETAARWAARNQCAAAGPDFQLPNLANDGARVRLRPFRYCEEPGPVDFYTVEDGGHTWPGVGRQRAILGTVAYDIHATLTMWEFFRPLRAPK